MSTTTLPRLRISRACWGFSPNIKVLHTAASGEEGIRRYRELKPDVVLMDTNLPDLHGIEVTAAILAEDPLAQIIFSALDYGDDLSEKAVDAGAAGFLTTPIDPDKLIEKVRRVAERRRTLRRGTAPLPQTPAPVARGKVICVYAPRGGAGCTTLAANLALLLHTGETPTVLIDGHRQYGDAAVLLNVSPRYALDDLSSRDEALEAETILEMLTPHQSGLMLLPSPASPEMGESITDAGYVPVLDTLQANFAYVVVDCQAHLDDLTVTSLMRADLTLVVLTPDVPSVKNTMQFVATLDRLSMDTARTLLVLNQADRRVGLKANDIARALHRPVEVELPFFRETVMDAVNRGDPLATTPKSNPLTAPLRDLVMKVRGRLVAEESDSAAPTVGAPRLTMMAGRSGR